MKNVDYVNILKYYKLEVPKSKRLLKKTAEKIMNEKLCKCIKKVDPENESKSIGICTKTIFNNRGFTRGKFGCKKKRFVTFKKTNKSVVKNTRRHRKQ